MAPQISDKLRVSGGRFSSIYKAKIGGEVVALKVVDLDDSEVPPHSLKVEVDLLKYLGKVSSSENVIRLLDTFTLHEERTLVFPYYRYTLTDFLKKNSRLKTNTAVISEAGHATSDPIDEYFECDDYYGDEPAYANGTKKDSLYVRVNKIKPADAVAIITKVLNGLASIHRAGIVHRDIKPENILLNETFDKLVITDFGISYKKEPVSGYDFTRAGESAAKKYLQISTGVYKPPEVILGITDYSFAVDMWCFGIIITQLYSRQVLPVLNKAGNFNDIALLHSIFQIFGTPTAREWPRVSQIKYFKDFNFTQFERKPTAEILPLLEPESAVREVFDNMMVYAETERITAQDALDILQLRAEKS